MKKDVRFLKDKQGNVFLEHAFLTFPLLLIGVVLLMNAAMFFHAYQVVSSASASGARTAARMQDSSAVIQSVQKELQAGALSIAPSQFNASTDVNIQFQDGGYCTVKVFYHFRFPFSFSKVGITVDETIDFSAGSSFVREW
jgi:Flp pilus assembly protein TadG